MMHKLRKMVCLLLAASMLFSVMAVGVSAMEITQKPANATTKEQPFLAGTGGSTNFRIPGIVTLNDGTLIAVCDARWNGTSDAGGLDTIVSVSQDNGKTWEYTFANYLGDNGDSWIYTSSCIIDPAIATDGTTAYMIADLFPAGFAINSARYAAQRGSTGFNADGNLILRSDEENGMTFGSNSYATQAAGANYGYYLKNGQIFTAAGELVEGYAVDAYFNIKGEGIDTNLFFSDSPYKPFPTDYLYMTTTTDGLNWSEPELLNLKAADEQTLLIGPGNGTLNASNGHMVFTAYEYDFSTQNTALVWRDTDGEWYRSENVATSSWTSEATCVALNDGTIRVFYRDTYSVLRYTDMVWDDASHNYVRDASATEVTTKAAKRSNNQLTSLVYSRQIDGKDVILVACAANTGDRRDGHLYVFLLNDDKTMELAYAYDINPGEDEVYAYNCISEMSNGDIALLYEGNNPDTNASAEIIFTTIDMDDVITFDNDARLNFIDVEITQGETWTLKDTTGNYASVDTSKHDASVAEVTATGITATVPATAAMNSGVKTALTNSMYTLTKNGSSWWLHHTLSDSTVVYIDAHAGSGNGGYPNRDYTTDLTLVNGTVAGTFWIKDSGGSLHLYKEKQTPYWDQCNTPCGYKHNLMFFRPAQPGETESSVFADFVQVTNLADLVEGEYLIAAQADNGKYYVLNPALGGTSKESNDHLAQFIGDAEVSSTTVAITGLKPGTTQVMVGSNVYNITVNSAPEVPAEELTMLAGGGVYFILDGEYGMDDVVGLDTTVATVSLSVTGDRQVYGELRHNTSGTRVELADSEYTFTNAGNGKWNATIAKDGNTWYVRPNAKGHSVIQTDLTLTFSSNGSVYIKDNTHYLYVNRNTLAWDRTGSVSGYEPHITFYLYGEGEDASSPIPGYKLITANDQITSGKGYLIAFYDAAGQLYVMDPTTRTANAYNQMAAVVNELNNAVTHVTVDAVSAGETTFQLAGKKYHVTVQPENYDPIEIPAAENVYKGPAVTITEKPANGTTKDQPFAPGTGGSTNFRIPGIVTLNDGTVIASTDARWNHAGDGAGLDTLVSVTKDNGKNWTYTFANYLGDNGNEKNLLSTAIIDPAIGANGTTAYMIADLFPAGFDLNTAKHRPVAGENGFDKNGNLMLRDLAGDTVAIDNSNYGSMAAQREYNFYLDLGTYEIVTINGTLCEDFTVDEYFNITYTDAAGVTHTTNLFFADSPFQPYPTDYLYLVTSNDGLNWSAPKLLNLQEDEEQTLLVGPGNGTYDAKTGRMVFTAYEHTGSYERACLIWMDEFGDWYRSEDATVSNWSSEASCVVLDDGTVRIFYRDGYSVLRYTDYKWDAQKNNYFRDPNATEVSTAAAKRSGCQLSAIKYSTTIDGKEAILVATPTYSANRNNGFVYVFLLNQDNSMELAYAYDIVPDSNEYYAYSCITELDNGNIGLIYESASAQLTYKVLDMDVITARDNDARLSFVDLDILTGESFTVIDPTGDYTNADTSELDKEVATVDMTATSKTSVTAQLGNDKNYSGQKIDLANCLYTFTKGEDGKWTITNGDLYLNTNGATGIPHGTASCTFTIETGKEAGTFYIRSTPGSDGRANYLYFDRAAYNWNRVNDLQNNATWMTNCSMSLFRLSEGKGTGEIPGYDRVTGLANVTEGQYLIGAKANNGGWYVAYPSTSSNSFNHIAKVADSATTYATRLTFKGVGAGNTEVVIGSTLYRIHVASHLTAIKTVAVGSAITIENATQEELVVADSSKVQASLADGVITIAGLRPGVTTVTQGRTQYVVTVTGNLVHVDLADGDQKAYVISNANAEMTQPDSAVVSITKGTGFGAQLGSAQSVYAGNYVSLEDCLYTFTPSGSNWIVSATAADGSQVYLQPYADTNGYPHSAKPVNVTLSTGNAADSVYIQGNGGYLYFYRDSKLYFDRVNKTQNFEAAISFLLYRPVAEGETSSTEIPGFAKVAGKDAVTEGQYLIVAQVGNQYYLAYPSLSQAHRNAQIAHVVSNAPTVVITGVSAGSTSFRVESTVFDITVSHTHQYESVVTDPTCTEGGCTTWTCACGDSYVTDETEATGHKYENGSCVNCGAKKPVGPVIVQQPQNTTAYLGEFVDITFQAEGEGLTYKWFYKDTTHNRYYTSTMTDAAYRLKMTGERNGRLLYCVVTDAKGRQVTTDVITLTIIPHEELKIVSQPTIVEGTVDQFVSVKLDVQGDELTYQWYYKDTSLGRFYTSSITDPAYKVKMLPERDGRQVYCVITDGLGNQVTSEIITLKALNSVPLNIVSQPADAEGALNTFATVSMEVAGDDLTYQWYYKDVNHSKFYKSTITDAEYRVKMLPERNGRQVYCVITDALGNQVTTDTVTMKALNNVPLEIVAQPTNVAGELNQFVSVTLEAQGDELTYQWYFKDTIHSTFYKSTITDPAYKVKMLAERDGRQVYCVITDALGNQVTTDIVTIHTAK